MGPTRLWSMRVSNRSFHMALSLVGLAALTGCATVTPVERDVLADPIMIFDENPIEKGHLEHHRDYLEGSAGGTGSRGGGCGCG